MQESYASVKVRVKCAVMLLQLFWDFNILQTSLGTYLVKIKSLFDTGVIWEREGAPQVRSHAFKIIWRL
jgi:hypothetical protein